MLTRTAEPALIKRLNSGPAVLLLGPRQIGKTTLALKVAAQFNGLYLDLESPADRARMSHPEAFLDQQGDRLVILDEVQRIPSVFPLLRGAIDRRRALGHTTAQFLLLGSASNELVNLSHESLAGRLSQLYLQGISPLELPAGIPMPVLWVRGGFPGSVLAADDEASFQWREDLLQAYIERDIPLFTGRAASPRLRRLMTMLAHVQGTAVNVSKLANSIEMSRGSVTAFLDLLENLLLLRRIQPWSRNGLKRLNRTPRSYIRDSGLLHRLLDIGSFNALAGHPVLGKSWEGFVIESVAGCVPWGTELFYYQSSGGAEIDLLLRFQNGSVWAIEIKYGLTPKIPSGYFKACDELGADRRFIVTSGMASYPGRDNSEFVSLPSLLRELQMLKAS